MSIHVLMLRLSGRQPEDARIAALQVDIDKLQQTLGCAAVF